MKTLIELTEDFFNHLAHGLCLSGYLVKNGKCICKLVSERVKLQVRFLDYEEFGLNGRLKSENASDKSYVGCWNDCVFSSAMVQWNIWSRNNELVHTK